MIYKKKFLQLIIVLRELFLWKMYVSSIFHMVAFFQIFVSLEV